jgi:thiol-disulfide isomerase/thioredoxin
MKTRSSSEPSFLLQSTATGDVDGGTTAVAAGSAAPPKVQRLQSLDDFLGYIDAAPQDSLAVVKFFAKSCPMCKKIEIKYKKMSRFYQTAPIQFAEIEKTAHKDLFPTLGVETYPYIQIYRNGQCVWPHMGWKVTNNLNPGSMIPFNGNC